MIYRFDMNKPLALSIIIPAYNEERHLKVCLDAIARQSVKPDEVIVVDNNSTDATVQIAQQYDFVVIIKEPKQGIVHARNAGFNAAKGMLIGRIDADTVLSTSWVETVKHEYAKYPGKQLALTGPCDFMNTPLPRLASFLHDLTYYGFSKLRLGHETLFGSNMVITKQGWLEAQDRTCTTDRVHEDTDLAVHLADDVLIRYVPAMRAGAALRMPFVPRAFSRYVGNWLFTLKHRETIRS